MNHERAPGQGSICVPMSCFLCSVWQIESRLRLILHRSQCHLMPRNWGTLLQFFSH